MTQIVQSVKFFTYFRPLNRNSIIPARGEPTESQNLHPRPAQFSAELGVGGLDHSILIKRLNFSLEMWVHCY